MICGHCLFGLSLLNALAAVFCEIYTVHCDSSSVDPIKEPWCLPVLPRNAPKFLGNKTMDKLIPRHLWMAVRKKGEQLNYQMPALFARNPNWDIHVEGNEEKDAFMTSTFGGTSLLWAYQILSPWAGAAKADIWRYILSYPAKPLV
jgi:mannosyltransferase OCH1-like enzyme